MIDSYTEADDDLDIQVDVFYDMKQKDEEQLGENAEDRLLLATHQEVVSAIMDKVCCSIV